MKQEYILYILASGVLIIFIWMIVNMIRAKALLKKPPLNTYRKIKWSWVENHKINEVIDLLQFILEFYKNQYNDFKAYIDVSDNSTNRMELYNKIEALNMHLGLCNFMTGALPTINDYSFDYNIYRITKNLILKSITQGCFISPTLSRKSSVNEMLQRIKDRIDYLEYQLK